MFEDLKDTTYSKERHENVITSIMGLWQGSVTHYVKYNGYLIS